MSYFDNGIFYDTDPPEPDPLPLNKLGFDSAPYADFFRRAYLINLGSPGEADYAGRIFDWEYNPNYRSSNNPYYSTGLRDALRELAPKLGLDSGAADQAALDYAQERFLFTGGTGFTDAVHPALVANEIAKRIFAKAGRTYTGLTPQQIGEYVNQGIEFQNRNKESDENAWKRDDFGGVFGLATEQIQQAWEKDTEDGWLPSEQALAGADNPLNTWLQNRVRNKDWDPVGNEYGLATKETNKKAQERGYDIGLASTLNTIAGQAIGFAAGDYVSGATEAGFGAAGQAAGLSAETSAQAAEWAQRIKAWSSYYKQYQNWQAGGEVNPGAVFTAATAGAQKVGDFDSSAFTGGDSPYNANSYFDETQYGSNFAGGAVYDDNGNWLDGTYDDQGNFIPADQTTFGDDPYGQGNDIFGGGNLEQSNPELFGGGLGLPNLSGLGSLFSGLGSSLSGLLGGGTQGGGGANTLLALAPILAAIQHARQQGPFDTSRLTGLADQYSPDSMAYQYDRNTEDQRRSLTSSLADRGVMGSSFGNMDISNFNTNRELGRGALISQASLGGADIANKILQAQIQQRAQQNQLYGSSLYALGNVFGGKR